MKTQRDLPLMNWCIDNRLKDGGCCLRNGWSGRLRDAGRDLWELLSEVCQQLIVGLPCACSTDEM